MYKHHKFLGKRQAALAAALVLSMGVCGTAWAAEVGYYFTVNENGEKSESATASLHNSTFSIGGEKDSVYFYGPKEQANSEYHALHAGENYFTSVTVAGKVISIQSGSEDNTAGQDGYGVVVRSRSSGEDTSTSSLTLGNDNTEEVTISGTARGIYNDYGNITILGKSISISAAGANSEKGAIAILDYTTSNTSLDYNYQIIIGNTNTDTVNISAASETVNTRGIRMVTAGGAITINGKEITISASSGGSNAYGVCNEAATVNIGTAVDGAAYENKITISATAAANNTGGTVYATGENAVINVGNDASTVEISYDTSKATGTDNGHYTAGVYSSSNASTTVLGQKISITSTSSLDRIMGVYSYKDASLTIGNANTEEITISVTKTSSSSNYATAVRAYTADLSMTGKEIALSSTVTSDAGAYGVICGSTNNQKGYQVTINSDATSINASAQGGEARGVWDNSNCGISIYGTALSIDAKSESNAAYAAIAEGNATIYLGAADSDAIAENSSLTISAVSSSSSQNDKYLAAGLYASGSGAVTVAAANNTITATNVASEADGIRAGTSGTVNYYGSALEITATSDYISHAIHALGVEDEDSETGYSGGGTINVGSEESGFDTVSFNASGAEASGVVAEKSGSVSVYGSGSDASSIVITAASTGGDADTQGLHADTTGSIIIGSSDGGTDAGFGAIAVEATGGENATGAFAENQGSISISGGDLTVSGDTRGLASETQGTINVEVTDAVITSEGTGVYAANGTYDDEAPSDAASVTITTENKLVITGGESAVEANSNGQVNLNGNVELTGEDAITAGGNATVNVNTDSEKAGTTKVTGDVVFQSDGTSDIVNAYVDLNLAGGESSWNGSSYIDTADGSSIDLEGGVTDFNVSIADGASWTTTGDSFVNNLTLDDGSLTTDHTVNIGNMTMEDGTLNIGTSGYVTVENMDGTTGGEVNIEATSELESGVLIVKSNTSDATMNFDVYYQGITADNIQTQDDLDGLVSGSVKIAGDANIDAHLTVAEGIVSGEITADIENSLEGGSTSSFERAEGTTKAMEAIGAVSGAAIIAWREEDATLSQRLGELREAQGGQGIWARMSRGEFKNNGTAENQYNLFQLGYDFGADAWHYGFAVSHNDGESAYEIGRGDNKSTSLSVYGTWLGNKGHYLDVVAKAGRLSTDYDLAIASGSVHGAYKTTGLALSGEYGRRLEFTGDWYVTPLAKLSLMRVEGKDYTTSNGVEIDQEALTSALGRVGVELGKKLAGQGSFYLKASYLHEFAGDAETVLSAGSLSNSYTQAIGSSWWEMGFGAHYRAADKTYIYADVIRTFGDDFSTPWQWNVGAYWNF